MPCEARVKLARRVCLVERVERVELAVTVADHLAVKWRKCLSFNRELAILSPAFVDKASSNSGR